MSYLGRMTATRHQTATLDWTVGDRLRKAREYAGLDRVQLADDIGIARNTVTNYEHGYRTPRKIVLNAWALRCKVSVDWLETGIHPGDGGGSGQEPAAYLTPISWPGLAA